MALLSSVFFVAACSTQAGNDVEDDGCAVSNQRIIQSDAHVGPGQGNFLNRARINKNADYERERARRFDCAR